MSYSYDFMNVYNARRTPGTVQCQNTALVKYFRRYLFQKCVSVLDFEIPEDWPKDFFLYVLYACGYVCVLDVPGYGVIPQWGAISGLNVYYQPRQFIVSNPAFRQSETRTIGIDGALIKLTPDYLGILDIIDTYADMMALTLESAGINVINSKFGFIFGARDKRVAESYKKMVDLINAGNPAVFVDKDLFNDQGELNVTTLQQDLKNAFITPDLLNSLKQLECMFDADIGLPNNPVEKKERLITDEVNANNASTFSKIDLWIQSIKESSRDVKRLFGIDIKVKARDYVNPAAITAQEAENDESDTIN